MMNIDEGNLIVKNVIYENMMNSIKIIKIFDEFGFYKYGIFTDSEKQSSYLLLTLGIVIFGFKCDEFLKIFEYSGKELIETEFKGKKP